MPPIKSRGVLWLARSRRKAKTKLEGLVEAILILVFFFSYAQTKQISTSVYLTFGVALLIIVISLIRVIMKYKRLQRSGIQQIDKMEGFEFERYLKTLLSGLGNKKVKVTQETGDYGADLIMNRDGKKIVIQAKRYNNKVGISAIQEISAAVAYYNADEAWVITNSYFTQPAKNLAEKNNVMLIDRGLLIDMILDLEEKKVRYSFQ